MFHPPDPIVLEPGRPDFAQDLAQAPRRDGIYLLEFASAGTDSYLGASHYLYKRLHRLFLAESPAPAGPRAHLRDSVRRILCWPTSSRLENWLVLCAVARERFPKEYRRRLKLRPPSFVSLLAEDAFPRLIAGNRIPTGALSIGPFRTRDMADAFVQETAGLFQLRRCEEALTPSPEHPGCIYGEMSLCLRPCQAAVSPGEYASEAQRAAHFLETDGDSLLRPLSAARDRASADMDFEQAARLHKQVEKIKAVCGLRGELVRKLADLNGIAVTRASLPQAVRLWPLVAGFWQAPLTLDFSPAAGDRAPEPAADGSEQAAARTGSEATAAVSMDTLLRQSLGAHLTAPRSSASCLDDLTLLSRWYYSSWRDGAWVPFTQLSKLNYRKLVREISTLLRDAPQ